ncbi:hypothetical protein EAI_12965 [Harpegnathos saltator]|uniref:Uncharacterized protein n=1 Tax=Harpegnathos saltator TaxID=610380 RepID=E2BZ48_HARSA|nr:hypothetical protein EAI_12965 [Harpegnathos saltator]
MEVAWWQGVTKPASDWTKGQVGRCIPLLTLTSDYMLNIPSNETVQVKRQDSGVQGNVDSRIATPVTNMFPDDSKIKFVPLAAYSAVTRRTSSMHVKSDILKRPDELSVRKYETYANSSAKYQFTDYDEIELVREDVIYAASFYYIIKRPVADKERASKHKISFKQEADVGQECPSCGFSTGNELFVDLEN